MPSLTDASSTFSENHMFTERPTCFSPTLNPLSPTVSLDLTRVPRLPQKSSSKTLSLLADAMCIFKKPTCNLFAFQNTISSQTGHQRDSEVDMELQASRKDTHHLRSSVSSNGLWFCAGLFQVYAQIHTLIIAYNIQTTLVSNPLWWQSSWVEWHLL